MFAAHMVQSTTGDTFDRFKNTILVFVRKYFVNTYR